MKTFRKKHTLKTYLITGIFALAPLVITLYLVVELFLLMDGWVQHLIPAKYGAYFPYGIPGLGVVLLLLFLILVGALTTNVMGRWLIRLGRKIIENVPVVSSIYTTLKKVFETLMGKGETQAFRQAVLIEYPSKNQWTIAFVTSPMYPGFRRYLSGKFLTVYVPTTPNPTSGYMLYVRQKDVKVLNIPVEEAFKLVLSMGILNPTKKPSVDRYHG